MGIQGVGYEDGDELLPIEVRAAHQAEAKFVMTVDMEPRSQDALSSASAARLSQEAAGRQRIAPEALIADFVSPS